MTNGSATARRGGGGGGADGFPREGEGDAPSEGEGPGLVGRAYDLAKSAWSIGRSVPVAGSVMGLWEGAASAAVAAATGGDVADLPSADAEVRRWIDALDRDVVGPALRALLRLLFSRERGGETVLLRSSPEFGPPPPEAAVAISAASLGEREEEAEAPEDAFLRHLDDQLSGLDASFRRRAAEAAVRARQLRVVMVAPLLDLLGEEQPPPVYPKSLDEENYIREALADSILFSRLDQNVRRILIDAFKPVDVTEGTDIVREGEKADYLYVVRRGTVRVASALAVDDEDGSSQRGGAGDSAVLADGEVFGEIALLFDCPQTATCTALTDCALLRLDRDTFRRVVEGSNMRRDGETTALLRTVPIFQDLDDNLLTRIACSVTARTFDEGEIVFRRGDVADMFCLVKEGRVEATDITAGGRRYDDCTFVVGECFGEEAIVGETPYVCDAVATERTTLLCIPTAAFVKAMGPYKSLVATNLDQKMLKAIPIENKLPLKQSEVEVLASAIVDADYEKNHVFYTEGMAVSPALFLVRSGRVSLKSSSGLGKVISSGGYFGNDSLGSDINVPFVARQTVVAKEDCRVGVLKGDDIESVLGLAPCDNIEFDDLTKHRIIGEGTFGQVWCVSRKDDIVKEAYALKVQYKRQLIEWELAEGAIREKNMMATINSEFIIRLIGTHQDEHRIFMLMKLYQGGELWSLIHDGDRHGLPESAARFYAANILVGLTHMHHRRILHRDMKPANVLLDGDGWAVIIDLGTAKFVASKTYTFCGTPLYLAPEIIQRSGHDKGADLWSWGVMLYEMLFGMTPFDDPDAMNPMNIYKNIVSGSFIFPRGSCVSSSARQLIKNVLAVEPTDRLGNLARAEKDIQQHPWFQGTEFAKVARKEAHVPWVPDVGDELDTRNFDNEGYVDKQCWEELPLDPNEQQMFIDF